MNKPYHETKIRVGHDQNPPKATTDDPMNVPADEWAMSVEKRLVALECQLALLNANKPMTYRGGPPDVEIFPGDQIRSAIHLTTEEAKTLRNGLDMLIKHWQNDPSLGMPDIGGNVLVEAAKRLRDQLPE